MVAERRDESSQPPPEPVWTYRGYQLKASEFTTAMVHFFRAEVSRANVWRQRLDATTNWAVVTTGAVISFAFTQAQYGHVVILLDLILVTMFLVIEARRYRYYELWSYRVRLMETDFFSSMLVPPFRPSGDWAESLAESLLHPQFPISELEAFGRRLRRNYLWIYTTITLAWIAKIALFPVPAYSLSEYAPRAAIGPIRGEWVIMFVIVMLIGAIAIGILTVGLQHSSGEVLPRYGLPEGIFGGSPRSFIEGAPWYRLTRKRQQILTLIITDKPEKVSSCILQEMSRGATMISGKGAYTGQEHSVMMCALTVTEIPQLKALVSEADPNAFVVVIPARGVFGKGFMPLEKEE
ncbi:MAG: DUF2270 domain-containing protein [Anaerolineales bacterium]|nr:DUF2270 domain-containing protein [Anaerolineales bacterium]